jgi:hypothetical protein
MGTAVLTEEVCIGARQFFKTNKATNELISEYEIQERKNKLIQRSASAGDLCFFFSNEGVEIYLYNINSESFTTLNEICLSSNSGDSDVWKFGYVNADNEIVSLFGNHYVANSREMAMDVFVRVKEYCIGRGKPFAYRR